MMILWAMYSEASRSKINSTGFTKKDYSIQTGIGIKEVSDIIKTLKERWIITTKNNSIILRQEIIDAINSFVHNTETI